MSHVFKLLACGFVCFAVVLDTSSAPAELPFTTQSEARSLARQKNISVTQAEADVTVQQRSGDISDILQERLGTMYAGLWFDTGTGTFHVGLGPGADRSLVETIVQGAGIKSDTKLDSVAHSWAEIEASEQALNSKLAEYVGRQEADVSSSAREDSVNVEVAATASPETLAHIKEAIGTSGIAKLAPVPSARLQILANGCSFPNCEPPERGGVRINSTPTSGGQYKFCTAGFRVKPTIKRPAGYELEAWPPMLLTAGHCFYPQSGPWWNEPWKTSSCELGYPTNARTEESVDAGLVVSSWCETATTAAAWLVNESLPVKGTRILSKGTALIWGQKAYEGEFECHYGATSETQCGTVETVNGTTSINYSAEGLGIISVKHTDKVCAIGLPGDSGGPWLVGQGTGPEFAYGTAIHIASTEKTCAEGGTATGYELTAALEAMKAGLG